MPADEGPIAWERAMVGMQYHYLLLIAAHRREFPPGDLDLDGGDLPRVVHSRAAGPWGVFAGVATGVGSIQVTVRVFRSKPKGLTRSDSRIVTLWFDDDAVAVDRFVDGPDLIRVPLPDGPGRYRVHVRNRRPSDPQLDPTDEAVFFTLWPERAAR